MMDENLNYLIGQKIDRVIVKMWPPFFDDSLKSVDISAILYFENNSIIHFTTDEDNFSLSKITVEKIDSSWEWETFSERLNKWFSGELSEIIGYEYYDFTDHPDFQNIVNNKVTNIQLLYINNDPKPFGIKLIFDKDYLLSTSNVDGNTIETKNFNTNNIIEPFFTLGEVKFVDAKRVNHAK